MLDPDAKTIWISDPGDAEKDPIGKPARIVKFDLVEGVPANPTIFYSKPGFLFSAKWAVPATIGKEKVLIVADQGKPTSEYTFTGEGAKVFVIPVLADGTAGTARVLWEGKPFACPTGVVLVGKWIYITDPCAGPISTSPQKPEYKFPTSVIFALDPVGSREPVTLKSGPPFTSLIGICPLIPGELIVNDTDSGRPDPGFKGGRNGFAPPASADRWILKIIDPDKPTLSDPVRTRFTEEGDLVLHIRPRMAKDVKVLFSSANTFQVRALGGTRIISTNRLPVDLYKVGGHLFTASSTDPVGERTHAVRVASDVMDKEISIEITYPHSSPQIVNIPKLPTDPNIVMMDNKHGGARERIFNPKEIVYDRFTLDNAPGFGAVYIYPDRGGTPVAIAKGAPLMRPLSGQLTPDGLTLFIADQGNASLFSLPFPSGETFDKLFGPQVPVKR